MNPPDHSATVREINRLHAEAEHHAADSRTALLAAVSAAWQAGTLLSQEKGRVRRTMGAGAWLTWLEVHFQGSPRTAQRYMLLARSESDLASLRGLSLRQVYLRLGISTEPKTHAQRVPIGTLPAHIRFAQRLVVTLQPCIRRITPDRSAAYRQDLRPLYELLRPLFESPGLAFHGPAINTPP